jgi:group I intron endonuclease
MIGGIYRIDGMNDIVYIGSAKNLDIRIARHKQILKRKVHHSSRLQNSVNRYGIDSIRFTILETCEPDKLLHYEQIWLDILFTSLDPDSICNTSKVAGNTLGVKHTRNTKLKMSALKGYKPVYVTNGKQVLLVESIMEFAIEHSLDFSHLSKVIRGKRPTHKGWRLN